MKAKLLVISILIFASVSISLAGPLTIDTRLGVIPDVGMTFRVSRIDYELTSDLSGRIVYSVLDGMGLTGNLNNYRIGLQGVNKSMLLDNKLFLDLAAGGSYSSSDLEVGAMSFDLGLDVKYRLFDWLLPVAGADMQIFTDSYFMNYYGGLSFPIYNWVALDLLYSAVLTNNGNKIGAAARINLYF